MRFDYTGVLLCKVEEYERAVLTLQNVSGETVSSAMKFGMILNRLGEKEFASHLVMNAERPTEWHDFRTEVINITRARAATAGVYTLTGRHTSNSGIQPMDVDAVSMGTGKGRRNESRICHHCGELGHWMEDCCSGKGKNTGGKKKVEDCRIIATVGEGETGEDDWSWNAQRWDEQHFW